MNRRAFLASLGIGLPSAVLAEKLGLAERVRSYFFAPKQGWNQSYFDPRVQFQLEAYVRQITDAMQRDSLLFEKIGRPWRGLLVSGYCAADMGPGSVIIPPSYPFLVDPAYFSNLA